MTRHGTAFVLFIAGDMLLEDLATGGRSPLIIIGFGTGVIKQDLPCPRRDKGHEGRAPLSAQVLEDDLHPDCDENHPADTLHAPAEERAYPPPEGHARGGEEGADQPDHDAGEED